MRTVWLSAAGLGAVLLTAILQYRGHSVGHNLRITALVGVLGLLLAGALAWRRLPVSMDRTTMRLLVALGCCVGLSTLTAQQAFWPLARASFYAVQLAFGYLLYLHLRGRERDILAPLLVVIGALHLVLLANFLVFLTDPGTPPPVPERMVPWFSNVRHFGYLGFVVAAGGSALVVLAPRWRALGLLLVATALFQLFLLGSRGALYTWLGFVLLVTALLRDARPLRDGTIAAVIATAGVWLVHLTDLDRLLPASIFQRLGPEGQDALYSGGRWEIWVASATHVLDHPWLGHGGEAFALAPWRQPQVVHPHNVVLQFLLEYGLLGTVLVALLLLRWIWPPVSAVLRTPTAARDDPARTVWVALVLGYLAFAQIDGLLYHGVPTLMFAILMAHLPGRQTVAPAASVPE